MPEESALPPIDNATSIMDAEGFIEDSDHVVLADDPLRFEDDDEPIKAEAPVEEAPAAEEPEAAPTEEPSTEEPAPEVAPEVANKAAQFDEFDAALKQDPAAVAQAIIDSMNVRQKQAFLAQYVPEAAAPTRNAFDVKAYEPQGEMEQAIAERWDDLEVIPALVDEAYQLSRQIEQTTQLFTPQVAEANVMGQIALAKIDAICEAFGIELPDPDLSAVSKLLADGKTPYRDAVRKSVSYKTAVDGAKQRRTPRPTTPGNESRIEEPIPEGTSMVEISRRLGYLKR